MARNSGRSEISGGGWRCDQDENDGHKSIGRIWPVDSNGGGKKEKKNDSRNAEVVKKWRHFFRRSPPMQRLISLSFILKHSKLFTF
jgi:hypothetical protein